MKDHCRETVSLSSWPLDQQVRFPLFRNFELLRHANEVGDSSNAKFLHHPATMNLDGFFDRTQFAGNLLVESSRHDMCKNLVFARRKSL